MIADDVIRNFTRVRQAWYAQPPLDNGLYNVDEVTIRLDSDEVSGEFPVRWLPVGDALVAQLQVDEDTWEILPYFTDLMSQMGHLSPEGDPVSVDAFCALLVRLGIKDETPRQAPASVRAYAKALGPPA